MLRTAVGGVVLAIHGETKHGALVLGAFRGTFSFVFRVFFAIAAAAIISAAVSTTAVATAAVVTAAGW